MRPDQKEALEKEMAEWLVRPTGFEKALIIELRAMRLTLDKIQTQLLASNTPSLVK